MRTRRKMLGSCERGMARNFDRGLRWEHITDANSPACFRLVFPLVSQSFHNVLRQYRNNRRKRP